MLFSLNEKSFGHFRAIPLDSLELCRQLGSGAECLFHDNLDQKFGGGKIMMKDWSETISDNQKSK